jgi:hypothetical protein
MYTSCICCVGAAWSGSGEVRCLVVFCGCCGGMQLHVFAYPTELHSVHHVQPHDTDI